MWPVSQDLSFPRIDEARFVGLKVSTDGRPTFLNMIVQPIYRKLFGTSWSTCGDFRTTLKASREWRAVPTS